MRSVKPPEPSTRISVIRRILLFVFVVFVVFVVLSLSALDREYKYRSVLIGMELIDMPIFFCNILKKYNVVSL